MNFDSLREFNITDAHIHLPFPTLGNDLTNTLKTMRISQVNLVSTPDPKEITHNPALISYKATHPQNTFICGGLDHFSVQADPASMPPAFANQVIQMYKAGFDGLKLLESKPIARKIIPIPMDSPIYEPMWSTLEEAAMPVVWHVADPEEFWDPIKCPQWVKDSGWFYGDGTYPLKETLYTEVENILNRHPRLKVILAHFFFLSADLDRASSFLESHPNVNFDLTPGSEMLFNFSVNLQKTFDFFTRYQDRILFGTDTGASAVGKPGQPLNQQETFARTFVVRTFLETDKNVEIPKAVSHWRREDAEIVGLSLPDKMLQKVYKSNFSSIFGISPKRLDLSKSLELIERQAFLLDAIAGHPVDTSARQVFNQLMS